VIVAGEQRGQGEKGDKEDSRELRCRCAGEMRNYPDF